MALEDGELVIRIPINIDTVFLAKLQAVIDAWPSLAPLLVNELAKQAGTGPVTYTWEPTP